MMNHRKQGKNIDMKTGKSFILMQKYIMKCIKPERVIKHCERCSPHLGKGEIHNKLRKARFNERLCKKMLIKRHHKDENRSQKPDQKETGSLPFKYLSKLVSFNPVASFPSDQSSRWVFAGVSRVNHNYVDTRVCA